MCTVFAESEVIGLIGKGEKRENIAYAVVNSIVQKVASQAGRLKLDQTVCLTGGLCECSYIRKALGANLRHEISAEKNGRYAGAIGAALAARNM
jgi:activator of 2-hydroxyglutaryl-CoA dehydratase